MLKERIRRVLLTLIQTCGIGVVLKALHFLLRPSSPKLTCILKGRIYREKIRHYDTEFLQFNHKDITQPAKVKIIMIPGNPGLIKFYDTFLDELHRLYDRDIDILGISHANHFYSKKCNQIYTLNQQIEHKQLILLREIRRIKKEGPIKLILIGHSIGCHMILGLLNHPIINGSIHKVMFLYPTLERMKQSPNGRSLSILFKPFPRFLLISTFRLFTMAMPSSFRQLLLAHLAGAQNNMKIKSIINDIADSNLLYNWFSMANDEMREVSGRLDYQTMNGFKDKVILYYGSQDAWSPLSYMQELKANVQGVQCILDDNQISHAFVLDHSIQQALIVNQVLNQNKY